MTYRILFAPDGKHWIDDKKNNRQDVSQAVMEARQFELLTKGQARTKVINVKTGFVVYDSNKAKKMRRL